MNKNKIITTFALAVTFLLLWWSWPKIPNQSKDTTTENQSKDVSRSSSESGHLDGSGDKEDKQELTLEKTREKYLNRARNAGLQMNRPIDFYGQIIDQNNQPLIDVKVKCETSYFGESVLPGLMPHHKKIERTTDTNGRFSIESENGLAMDIKIDAQRGYEFINNGMFGVSVRDQDVNTPPISTPAKPYIFHAFKYSNAETLLHGAIAVYNCVPDGRGYIVDFRKDEIFEGLEGGDLKISIQRPLKDAYFLSRNDYDWSVSIQGEKADILETHDKFMYQAPSTGYAPSWSFLQKVGQPEYSKKVAPKIYFRSRDSSTYGRLEFEIISDYNDYSAIIVKYSINPAGSQNLEPTAP